MIDVARSAVKEKVIRVIVATWKNLVQLAPQSSMAFIVDKNTADCLYSIKSRKLKDEDLKADIAELIKYIEERQSHMTTWDFYANEIDSGKLSWTPAHQDEAFWKMHATKLDEDNYHTIKGLQKILQDPESALSAAVACHDIGQYVHYNPKGKQ